MAGENQTGGNTQPPEAKPVVLKEGEVVVSQAMLAQVLAKQQDTEIEMEKMKLKNAGLEELFAQGKDKDDPTGEKKLRERKNYTPAFRTVTLKKFSVDEDPEHAKIVVGWTNRGSYRKVDRSGVAPEIVNYLDIILLDDEKTEDGKLKAYSVPLLTLLEAEEVTCKVLEMKDYKGEQFRPSYPPTGFGEKKVGTGEVIRITSWSPEHGLIETGEEIDGWVGFTDLSLILQIPGRPEPLEIDQKYVNA